MKPKNLLWIAALVAAIALVFLGLRPRPVEVDLGTVARGNLVVSVDEDGETRIREPYLISAPLAGRLLRVEFEPGDRLSRDQQIAAIDPGEPGLLDARSEAEARARVSAAEAAHQRAASQFDVAKAEVEKAERYHQRDLGRFETGSIAHAIVEDAAHALRVARGNLTAAQSSQEIARFDWEQAKAALLHSQSLAGNQPPPKGRHFVIHSPIEGVVLRKFQESSTVIPAGERILEIGDPRDLEVRIDVLSQDAVRIEPGQRVIVEHWGGDRALTAWVRRVEPSAFTKVSALGVDEQRVWIYADFAGEAAEKPIQQGQIVDPAGSDRKSPLGDAYRVEARIVVSEKPDALTVPAGALFRDGADWCVFRVAAGHTAALSRLRIGERNDEAAEVLDGLAEGDRVVLHPGDKVREGVSLRARE